MSKYPDISKVADPHCDHEIDLDGPTECVDDMASVPAREAAWYCNCKKCGGSGMIVDDTGDFWLDEYGQYC
jgi:hypothetical protein